MLLQETESRDGVLVPAKSSVENTEQQHSSSNGSNSVLLDGDSDQPYPLHRDPQVCWS